MTKQDAIEAMINGAKVTHRYFTSDEWVTMKNGLIVLEDGVSCHPFEFWCYRTAESWNSDWELFEEPKQVEILSRANLRKNFEDDGAYAD